MKQLIRRFFGKPNSNRTITDSAADARSSELETLEPRMLFSAGPVEAPDDANPEADGQDQAAEESVVVNPAAARAAADSVSETESTQEGLAAEQTGLGQSAVPGNQGVRLLEVDDTSGQLNQETLEAIAEAAADRWRATGLTADQEAALDAIDYQVDSLANFVLGEASGHSITVDDNAGGRGWFIDSTPLVDEEFTLGADGILTSTLGDAGSGHDLLTVLLHEQGHILGIEDQAANLDPADVMSGTIGAGLRRLPGEDQADGALPGSIEDTHFAISTLGTPASVAAEQTPSMSYTLADGDDRLLVVMILDEGGFGVTAVSFGSTPLTMLGEVAGSNFQILQVWYKEMGDSLTSTTDTITATFTDNLPNDDYAGVIAAVAYEGVNQTTPVEGFVSSDGTLSTSVTSEVGDLVVGAAYNFGDDLTAGPGQTAIHTHNVIDVSPGSGDANFMTSSEAGAAAVTMSYTAPSLTDAVTMAFNINSDAPPSLDPEIKIEHTPSAVEIPDGDTTPTGAGDEGTYYDSVDTATGMVTRTFTITNTGNADLTLTGASPVSVDDNTHFSVTQPALTTLTPLATTTFTVTFNPNADGLQSTTVHVASDDGDEADYDFLVEGIGTTLSPTNITQLGSEGSISNDGAGFGTTTTLTLPFTVEAGTNRLLVVFGHEKETAADAEITGVTFQSTGGSPTVFPLTGLNLAIEAVDGSGLQQTEIYHLALGSGGQITGNIVMSISDVSGDNDATMLTAVAYENVDQTAPVDGFVSTNGSASTSALNVVSEAGDRVVSVHANRSVGIGAAADPMVDAAQTVIHELDAVQGASYLVTSTEPGGVLIDTLHSWNSAPEPSQDFVTVAMNINAAPPEDYGDAPDSYLTLGASGGAAHIIDANLFMGAAAPDGDSDGFGDGTEDNVNLATDDDTETATPDDEDGVASFAALSAADTSYSVDVTVSNNTGSGSTLIGWIDFDGDGIFQADEGASVAVANGTSGGTATLNWTGLGTTVDITDGDFFARFRLTTDGGITTSTPGGAATDGEVEDYALTIDPGATPDIDWDDNTANVPAGAFVLVEDAGTPANDDNGGTNTIEFQRRVVNYNNTASSTLDIDVQAVNGTDSFTLAASGFNSGSVTFSPASGGPLTSPASTTITGVGFDASVDDTAGLKTGFVTITDSETGLGDNLGDDRLALNARVLDPANASFSTSSDLDTLTVDFGTQTSGTGAYTDTWAITNREGLDNFTLDLDFVSIADDGDPGPFDPNSLALALFGDQQEDITSSDYTAELDTAGLAAGTYTENFTLTFASDDESKFTDVLGVSGLSTQTLTLTLTAVITAPSTGTTALSLDGSGNLVIEDADGADTDDNLSITRSGGFFIVEDLDGNTVSAAIGGAVQVSPSRVDVPDTAVTGGVIVNTLGGNDTVTIGDLGTLAGELTVDGGAGEDAIIQTGDATLTGASAVDYDAERISLGTGSSLTTGSGDVDIDGTGRTGSGAGVQLAGADITSTSGNVGITGEGGDSGHYNRGILLSSSGGVGGTISTGGSVTLNGTGGTTGVHATGVTILGSTVESTGAGPVTIMGTGGTGTFFSNGVTIHSFSTVDSGTGNLIIDGTGGSTGGMNRGVFASNSDLNSSGGNIEIDGMGDGASFFGVGVELDTVDTTTTGTGTVTIRGTGATGTLGNMGIKLANGSTVNTVNGAIEMRGTGNGSSTINHGIQLATNVAVGATGSGTVTVIGTGGAGTLLNHGVQITTTSTVSAAGGLLTVTGSARGTLSLNKGVEMIGSDLSNTTGSIALTGTGSDSGTGVYNTGVFMSGGGITTASGDITINGLGGEGTTLNEGVRIATSVIESTGSGNLSLTGEAQNPGTTAVYNTGMYLLSMSLNSGGTINVTGTGGAGTLLNHGVYMQNVTTTGTVPVPAGTVGVGLLSLAETGNFFP